MLKTFVGEQIGGGLPPMNAEPGWVAMLRSSAEGTTEVGHLKKSQTMEAYSFEVDYCSDYGENYENQNGSVEHRGKT